MLNLDLRALKGNSGSLLRLLSSEFLGNKPKGCSTKFLIEHSLHEANQNFNTKTLAITGAVIFSMATY